MNEAPCNGNQEFLIGAGIHDITGPAADREMIGYVQLLLPQLTGGIHMRLRSRAFIIVSPCNGKRIVFVSADLGMVFQAVKQEVVRRLRESYGDLYGPDNVIISATHTHAGPGGYSHYVLYNAISLGFDPQNFEVIVSGIYESIAKAHDNLVAGTARWRQLESVQGGVRSQPGYRQVLPRYRSCHDAPEAHGGRRKADWHDQLVRGPRDVAGQQQPPDQRRQQGLRFLPIRACHGHRLRRREDVCGGLRSKQRRRRLTQYPR